MENAIKIAADSVKALRKSDVYRVLEQNPEQIRSDIAAYIILNRADLEDEVNESMEDLM